MPRKKTAKVVKPKKTIIDKKIKNLLDIGAGGSLRNRDGHVSYGTDIVDKGGDNMFQIDHTFDTMEDIVPDESIDYVTAFDILEHIPTIINYRDSEGRGHTEFPRIRLLRDIYRVMKPGAQFESRTPFFRETPNGHMPVQPPHHPGHHWMGTMLAKEWCQDPTHAGVPWARETWNYFCGGYRGVGKSYGIDYEFKMVSLKEEGGHLHVIVAK